MSPIDDGKKHINIYSKGKTELGRFLSNFARSPIETEDGKFMSIEGYWYWLGCKHPEKDLLRKHYGYKAKQIGRELGGKDWLDNETFKSKIKKAMNIKITSNVVMLEAFRTSTLPFTHYYVYGNKICLVPEAYWIIEEWERLRRL